MYKQWKRRADNFVDVDVDCKCSKVSQVVSCQNRERESPDVSHVMFTQTCVYVQEYNNVAASE